ncbi:MAG: CPBP family intramembrane metalloprotease [Chlorobiaceae bacterium]|nr:CPBP family intramembrane metalloprotease [Chlorobiaceae bacterium]
MNGDSEKTFPERTGRSEDRAASWRHVAVFAVVAVSAGWIGRTVEMVTGSPTNEGPEQLLWIVLPVMVGLLLRGLAGDGWRDSGVRLLFAGNGRWYLFSLLFYPVCTFMSVLVGMGAGLMQIRVGDADTLFRQVVIAFFPALIKNLFEEFAWRGYLTPRLAAAGVPDMANHALTGMVWAAWHVPYYLFFLDRATFAAIAPHGLMLFFVMMVAGVVSLAFVYGELRLLTGSVWPLVVLHTVSNAVTGTLFLNGTFWMAPMADLWVSPLPGSALSIALCVVIWIGLSRSRRTDAE